MQFIEGQTYHIYNRGNNNQKIFFRNDNYIFFLRKMRKELLPYCEILAYCLMPNHFHMMAAIKSSDDLEPSDDYKIQEKSITKKNLNTGIAILLRSYTRAIQKQEGIKGSLFQQKTKSQELNNDVGYGINQPAICMHYIHQNPLRAGITESLENWNYSSFKDYAGLRKGTLCNKELGYLITGLDKNRFLSESYEVIDYVQK